MRFDGASMADPRRAHGVTPGLSQDYRRRAADRQAAFALPFFKPGMDLVDLGCGPGTISLGLAETIAPGFIIGVDHDKTHVEEAEALASKRGVSNVKFERASTLNLPFPDETFDAAFENDMFIHLADRAVDAAREAFRVIKKGGVFAARDADASLAIWGHPAEDLRLIDGLMMAWQASRGSDVTLGSRLPDILRQAGFGPIVTSVSADTKGDAEDVHSHAKLTASLLDGPMGQKAVEEGWVDQVVVERLKGAVLTWADHPDAFFANVHIEVIGRKSG